MAAYLDSTTNLKWADKQGVIKIDAINGSIEISEFKAITISDGEYFTASIPEPNSVALIFTGAGIFYLRRKKVSIRDRTPHR